MMGAGECEIDKGSPLRPLRLSQELHACLVRKAISLAAVTRDAGADDILPRRLAAAIPWEDMVEVQILAIENLPAVLTRVLVPLEDIVPGELHFLFGKTIEQKQDDDPWNADIHRDGTHHLGLRLRGGELPPTAEIMREEVVFRIAVYHLRVALEEKRKRPADAAGVYRLPEPVENEHGSVQCDIHQLIIRG